MNIEKVDQTTALTGAENKQPKGHPDVAIRTIQFTDKPYTNISFAGIGYGTSIGKNTSAYATLLAGRDSGSKKPAFGGLGLIESKYKQDNNKVWVSQELYGEYIKEPKSPANAKITYTPIKINAQVTPKVNINFDPRLALCFNGKNTNTNMETLTTVAASFNKNLSAYAQFQTYDFKGTKSVNGGIVWTF